MTAETAAGDSVLAPPPCRNCGAPAPGAYCPACGQETLARLPKFTQFLREAAGRYVALDGRLWKTLAALLFRPGFLTREYFAGRRRRYVRPARLFLVASLLLFAILRIFVEMQDVDVAYLDAKEGATKGAPTKNADREGVLRIEDDINVDLGVAIPALRKRIERFNRLSSQEKEAQIVDGIFRYGPYAMFVLLPAFGLLLKVVYFGRRRRHPTRPRLYSEHLVFAAHNTAFLSFAIIAAVVVPFDLVRAAVSIWILVYLLWSMRAVYGGSWFGIAARAFTMVIAYLILFGLVTAALVIAAVILR